MQSLYPRCGDRSAHEFGRCCLAIGHHPGLFGDINVVFESVRHGVRLMAAARGQPRKRDAFGSAAGSRIRFGLARSEASGGNATAVAARRPQLHRGRSRRSLLSTGELDAAIATPVRPRPIAARRDGSAGVSNKGDRVLAAIHDIEFRPPHISQWMLKLHKSVGGRGLRLQ